MAKIVIDEFKGILPKLANDKLPMNMAQVAADLKTASGELVAIKASSADVSLPGSAYKSLYQYQEGANAHWVYKNTVDFWAEAPVADDTFERMYWVDSVNEYRAFANDINSAPWDFTADYYSPGAPSGTAPTITPTVAGATYLAYYYTYVSRYGEEGPGSAITEITNQTVGNRVHVDDIETPAAGSALLTTVGANAPGVRIYRTATDGSGGAEFLFVCEATYFDEAVTYAAGDFVVEANDLYECTVGGVGTFAGGTHTFVQGENVAVTNLGTTNDSFLWDKAPTGMSNLRSHPNGFYVASKGKTLHFSEPFAPWAWPEDYQIPVPATIVGIGVYGSTIVVATDANIYTFSGPHPTSLHKQRLAFEPCLSQRGVVETDAGVMFPAQEGFQLVDQTGSRNVTADLFAPEDWDDFELETMHGVWYNKAYYGFFSDESSGNIRIDFLNQSITTGADYHWAAHVAVSDGIFRTIFASDISNSSLYISQWDNDPTRYRNYQYKSPRIILERPANFKVAQVIIDTDFYNDVLEIISDDTTLADLNAVEWATGLIDAPINGAPVNDQDINGDGLFSLSSLGVQSYVDFKIYVNSVLKYTKQVSDSNLFKLPRGFKHKKWEIEVIGMIPVKRIIMATSTLEITND